MIWVDYMKQEKRKMKTERENEKPERDKWKHEA